MPERREHEPALDGLRGLAILLVLGVHAPTKPLISGFVGVTVFFCLSGYLITNLLAAEIDKRGGVDFLAFARRRFARLYPALLTVIVVTVAVLVIGRRDLGGWHIAAPALAALGYVMNLLIWNGHVFATGDFFNYTWTLAIEEQFYLLWPAVMVFGYRRSRAGLAGAVVTGVVGLVALDVILGLSVSPFDDHAYYGSDTNALPILAGAALALLVRGGWFVQSMRRVSLLAGIGLVVLPVIAWRYEFIFRTSLATVIGTACSLLLIAAIVLRPARVLRLVLANPVAVWLGTRSYSIYLWNILLMIAARNTLGENTGSDLAWLAATCVVADLSYRLVETPLRSRLAGRRVVNPPVTATAAH